MERNITDILAAARSAVDELDLDPDLRPLGFFAAALLEGGIVGGPGNRREIARGKTANRDFSGSNAAAPSGSLARLAARLGVDEATVDSAFYVDEQGRPQLGLARAKLGSRKAEAARQVALLYCVARQFDGDEQFTPASAIRGACQDYGVFDTGNFAKTLVAMGDVFQFQGTGPSRRVRVVRPGYEEAARLTSEVAT